MEEITHVLEYEDGRLEGRSGGFDATLYAKIDGLVAIHEVCKTHRRASVFRVVATQKRPRRHRLPSGESKYLSEMTEAEKAQLNAGLAKAREARRKKALGLTH